MNKHKHDGLSELTRSPSVSSGSTGPHNSGQSNYLNLIGKGSFSNVYLIKHEIGENNQLNEKIDANLTNSLIFDEIERESFYIIKEVNLNLLVKKYVNRSQRKFRENDKYKRNIEHDKYKRNIENDKFRRSNDHIRCISPKNNVNGIDIRKQKSSKIVNITPYSTFTSAAYHKNKNKNNNSNNGVITTPTIDINVKYSENEYYYNKLKELIDSEIEILKNVDHKNITRYISNAFSNDIYFIKMEYCNMGDVYTFLKASKQENVNKYNTTDSGVKKDCEKNDCDLKDIKDIKDLKDIKDIKDTGDINNRYFDRNLFNGFKDDFIKIYLVDTVCALKYIHDRGLIHRDIKLHNILMKTQDVKDRPFLFKLSDFGFTCHLDNNQYDNVIDFGRSSEIYSFLKKKYYKLCGTPYYMAPEMILNIEKFEQLMSSDNLNKKVQFYDSKIDLWSYGICLYELIFNILPFSNMTEINDLKFFYNNSNTQNLIYKNIDEKHIISDDIKILLKKLLTIDPDYRFSTDELYDYIQDIVSDDKSLICESKILSSSVLNYKDIDNTKKEGSIQNVQGNNLVIYELDPIDKIKYVDFCKNDDKDTKDINFKNLKEKSPRKLSKSVINMDSWAMTDFEKNTPDKFSGHSSSNLSANLSANSLEIDKSIMKMSIDNKFMKWLIKK